VADVRQHPRAVCRAVQCHRLARRATRPEFPVAGADVRAAADLPETTGSGHEPRSVRVRVERRQLAVSAGRRPGAPRPRGRGEGARSRLPNPAQSVLGVRSTLGRSLPKTLRIYAFGAALGGAGVLADARQLAQQSHIPPGNLTLIDRRSTYAHNDPAGAFPRNVFFQHLAPFLVKIAALR
jgi:hypothetical protein